MASNKPKTRVTIQCNGITRQLMSFQAHKDDLIIVLNNAGVMSDPPYAGKEIKQQRFSVHHSPKAKLPINVIKQTITLKGNGDSETVIETVLDTTAPKSGKVQEVLSRFCTHLSGPSFNFTPHERDIEAKIGSFDPKWQTLLMSVFISLEDGPARLRGSHRYRQKSIKIGKYKVHIVYTLFPAPAPKRGVISHVITSSLRINKGPTPETIMPYADGMTINQAGYWLKIRFEELKNMVIESYYPHHLPYEAYDAMYRTSYGFRNVKKSNGLLRKNARRAIISPLSKQQRVY